MVCGVDGWLWSGWVVVEWIAGWWGRLVVVEWIGGCGVDS